MTHNVRLRDKFVRTLTLRQVWPRNISLLPYRPRWMPILTRSPFPSNVLYGRPRTINRDPFLPPVPVNSTPPVITSDGVVNGSLCSLETPGVYTNDPDLFEYQWLVDDVPAEGETNPAEFDTSEVAHEGEVTLEETASNNRGSGSAVSNKIVIIWDLEVNPSEQGAGEDDYGVVFEILYGVGPYTMKVGAGEPFPVTDGYEHDFVSAATYTVLITDSSDPPQSWTDDLVITAV